MSEEVFARTVANRRLLADFFVGLDGHQLDTASLCAGWQVRDVLGHLVMSVELGFRPFLIEVLRDRGRVSRSSQRLACEFGQRPVAELVRTLRHLSTNIAAPGVGPLGPLADACIHLRDVAIPLGMDTTVPLEDWRSVLNFLITSRARAGGFVPRGRLDGLAFRASDQDWSTDTSAADSPIIGPSESLALAISGRRGALGQLTGAGVERLQERLRVSR